MKPEFNNPKAFIQSQNCESHFKAQVFAPPRSGFNYFVHKFQTPIPF